MIDAAELVGTAVFAISGVIAVARLELDWFGAVVVGVVTAVGGGTMRGLILGHTPVFWVEDQLYLLVAAVAAVAAIPVASTLASGSVRRFDDVLQLADAAGLALFAVVGASITLDLGFGGTVAVVCGILTGVGGGVIRDLIAGRKPLIMRGEIYATAALAGVLAFVLLYEVAGVAEVIAGACGMAVVFSLRVAGIRRGWSLPSLAGRANRQPPVR